MPRALWINEDAGSPAYDAQRLRRAFAAWLFPGVSDRFGARQGIRPGGGPVITVSGTTWTQHDLTAVVYPAITSVSGPYVVEKPEESGSLNPADGTNPRIDALDLQVRDDDEDSSGQRDVRVVYVPGTPAGSPAAPGLTANSLRLGTILVPAGGSPSPSVATLAAFTVAAGGVLPMQAGEAFPTAGVYEGMYADRDEALHRNTSGVWVPAASPQAPLQVRFTSSGNFVKATYPWAHRARVRVQAGGGAGGGAVTTGATEAAAGGGGGAGSYSESILDLASLAASVTVTVGTGGTGSAGATGGDGGASSFGTLVTTNGGSGGTVGSAASGFTSVSGGAGGDDSGTSGDFTVSGGGGQRGERHGSTPFYHPGPGGASVMGPGGRTQVGSSNGFQAPGPGAGGAGGNNGNSQGTARSGGNGRAGIVIIDLY